MTKICGLVPNSTELDEAFAAMMLRTTAEDPEREARTPQASSGDEESVGIYHRRRRQRVHRRFLGSPDKKSEMWSLILRQTQPLFCGSRTMSIRTAMRWVLWSWSKQIYLTDTQQTEDGLDTLLRGKPLRRGRHKDLWRRIAAALEAKGTENFHTLEIKAHQTAQQRAFESAEEMLCREKNERADALAVAGAKSHAIKPQVQVARKHEVKRAQDVQLMLRRVWINRYWRSRNGAEEYRDTNEDELSVQTQPLDTLNRVRARRKKTSGATTGQLP